MLKKTMKKKFTGVVVPIVTPFSNHNTIDANAVTRICKNCGSKEVSVLALGTTGESPSISETESRRMIEIVSGELKGKVYIYACISGNCVKDNIRDAKAYIEAGADVIVSLLPSYYGLTPHQMQKYYVTIADAISVPLMIYNIPSTTNMTIPLEIVEELSFHPNIQGFKDSERSRERIIKSIEIFKERKDFSFFVGYAAMSAEGLRLGADGIVPSTGNIVPELFKQLYDFAITGQKEESERLQRETDEIAKIYQSGRSLGESLQALKVIMNTLGLCEAFAIPPLTELSEKDKEEIISLTKKMVKKETVFNTNQVR